MNQQTAYSNCQDSLKCREMYINTLESKFHQGLLTDDEIYDAIQAVKSDLQLIESLTKITDNPIHHLIRLNTKELEQNLKPQMCIEKVEYVIRWLKANYVSRCLASKL